MPPEGRAATPPRTDLCRMAPFALRAADDEGGDGLTMDGYAAVFGRVTVIDSWEGRFREQLMPGAMRKSFRENPPRVQFDHGTHPLIGSIPIGQLRSATEDTDPELAPQGGAHIVARLHDNWLVEPVRDAIASQSINGMSFRFSVVREEWHTADGKKVTDEQELHELLRRSWKEDVPEDELLLRSLKELKVPEVGPVVWPAYGDTSVAVRAKVTIDLGRLADPEQRSSLARAVMLADAAERSTRAHGSPPVTAMAVRHDLSPTGTPQPTDSPSAGEHESAPPRGQRPIDMWVRKARDTVLGLDKETTRR